MIGMDACHEAHHWAQQLTRLGPEYEKRAHPRDGIGLVIRADQDTATSERGIVALTNKMVLTIWAMLAHDRSSPKDYVSVKPAWAVRVRLEDQRLTQGERRKIA